MPTLASWMHFRDALLARLGNPTLRRTLPHKAEPREVF